MCPEQSLVGGRIGGPRTFFGLNKKRKETQDRRSLPSNQWSRGKKGVNGTIVSKRETFFPEQVAPCVVCKKRLLSELHSFDTRYFHVTN